VQLPTAFFSLCPWKEFIDRHQLKGGGHRGVFDKRGGGIIPPAAPLVPQFMVGIENCAPSLMPDGQRAVTVLVLV
jgi:hypothetical protein